MKKIIVTGGAGFIGSHTVVELAASGYLPIIIDNFSNSLKSALLGIEQLVGRKVKCYETDCNDLAGMERIFQIEKDVFGVIHFAAYKSVSESEREPLKYYQNNLGSLVNVIKNMQKYAIPNLVFSSSATVYGQAEQLPVTENMPFKVATSAYGQTKQMCEQMIEYTVRAHPALKATLLRYFNPVGAHASGLIGELPLGKPENLVPYITQTAAGLRDQLVVFGKDYQTADGTCVRDYIHVVDLARAHVKALDWLGTAPPEKMLCEALNVGTGRGHTVLELIKVFEKTNSLKLNYSIGDRRKGDIEQIYASCDKICQLLGWEAELSLADALRDAWTWQRSISARPNAKQA